MIEISHIFVQSISWFLISKEDFLSNKLIDRVKALSCDVIKASSRDADHGTDQ